MSEAKTKTKTRYMVRQSRGGKTWAVDKLLYMSRTHHIKANTTYFDEEKEARDWADKKDREMRGTYEHWLNMEDW